MLRDACMANLRAHKFVITFNSEAALPVSHQNATQQNARHSTARKLILLM